MATRISYEFGEFRFEPHNARLTCAGRVVPLTAKATEVLHLLVHQPDVLVTKDVLMASLWPDAAVHDNNLNQQISALRKALGTNGGRELIETVPRRGYRFSAAVRQVPIGVEAAQAPISPPSQVVLETPGASAPTVATAVEARNPRPALSWRLRWIAATLSVLSVAGVIHGAREWRQREAVVAEAREAFNRGRELLRRGDARTAATELQRAIALDPNHAVAYSTLAHALHKYSFHEHRPAGDSPSIEAARRAVAIDPRCGTCQGSLGFFLFFHGWEWASAEAHLREAIRLAPDSEAIRPSYALLLLATRRPTAALGQIDFALGRQPYHVGWHGIRASNLYLQRHYHEAVAASDRALAVDDKERSAWEWRSRALFQLGRGEEAVRALARGSFAHRAADLERAVGDGGAEGGLRELLAITGDWNQREDQSWRRAPWRLLLNDADGALDELEVAYRRRNFNLIYIGLDPVFDPLRTHPRFQEILAGMGLGNFSHEWEGSPVSRPR